MHRMALIRPKMSPKLPKLGASLLVGSGKTFEITWGKLQFYIVLPRVRSLYFLNGPRWPQDKIAPKQPRMLTEVGQAGTRWPL